MPFLESLYDLFEYKLFRCTSYSALTVSCLYSSQLLPKFRSTASDIVPATKYTFLGIGGWNELVVCNDVTRCTELAN